MTEHQHQATISVPLLLKDGREYALVCAMPRSMMTRLDMSGELSLALSDDLVAVPGSLRLRVFGAALGVACGGQRLPWSDNPRHVVPVYSGDGGLRAYGAGVLEALAGHGVVMRQPMWDALIHWMLAVNDSIPTEAGVRRAQNFTSPDAEPQTPGSE